MVTGYAVEQMHPETLNPEHPNAMADHGPFKIEIIANETVAQLANLERRCIRMRPVNYSRTSERDSAGQLNGSAGKGAKMLPSIFAADWFVEESTVHADHAVASDHPLVGRSPIDIESFRPGQFHRDQPRLAGADLQSGFIDC